jgi:CDGSH-type Zn-finger protein/uncharacterized Fe-S cluster protein YjdI
MSSTAAANTPRIATREGLLHALYEAAELEHNLMCTYLYAACSLKDGEAEGLSATQAAAVARWRRAILDVAIDEMSHLVTVWNITSALGATPRFGRGNFPLDPGVLPAGVVVRLAPFNAATLQHFIHLERPAHSTEPDGAGYAPEFQFSRAVRKTRLTPMGLDYDTVGAFYAALSAGLRALVARRGEAAVFCGDPALQLSVAEAGLPAARPVICARTALAAFAAIVEQGEGAQADAADSHFHKFTAIRAEHAALRADDPDFEPAFPAAVNPVLRTPMRPAGRVWIEDEAAAATADVANAAYGLMLRLIAYAYQVPRPAPDKSLAVDLALGLMRAFTPLAQRTARLPAGPSHPQCHAGVSFVALRDAAPLPPGPGARRYFTERLGELMAAAAALGPAQDPRIGAALRAFTDLERRARQGFAAEQDYGAPAAAGAAEAPAGRSTGAPPADRAPDPATAPEPVASASLPERAPVSAAAPAVEVVEGARLTVLYEGKRCIHARFCVTGAPTVFLANVQGPWIHPDTVDAERLVAIAHACPSGAIRYTRKDGRPEETAPPVNLLTVREAGPYAVLADLLLGALGRAPGFRATLCRCGASKNKPFCDSSHHATGFAATGEPATTEQAAMLPRRDGPLSIEPLTDGPLSIQGNLEIVSGTGRVVARVTQARLCRCGASGTKPFCDGSHARVGFVSG